MRQNARKPPARGSRLLAWVVLQSKSSLGKIRTFAPKQQVVRDIQFFFFDL